jgi:hypothetical protein
MTLKLSHFFRMTPHSRSLGTVSELHENVDSEYEIYLFYLGPKENLEPEVLKRKLELIEKLEDLGYRNSKTLIHYAGFEEKLMKTFRVNSIPTIIITGNNKLASIDYTNRVETACIIIEGKNILSSSDLLIQLIEGVIKLFKEKRMHKFLEIIKNEYGDEQESKLTNLVLDELDKKIAKIHYKDEIKIYITEGEFLIH